MGEERKGSSQGTSVKDPWTRTMGQGGLNVGEVEGQGREEECGKNGDNYIWVVIFLKLLLWTMCSSHTVRDNANEHLCFLWNSLMSLEWFLLNTILLWDYIMCALDSVGYMIAQYLWINILLFIYIFLDIAPTILAHYENLEIKIFKSYIKSQP